MRTARSTWLTGTTSDERIDLRLLPIAASLWGGALLGLLLLLPHALLICAVAALAATALLRRSVRARKVVAGMCVACLLAGALAGASRAAQVRDGPVVRLARQEAQVHVTGVVTSDPDLRGSDDTGGDDASGDGAGGDGASGEDAGGSSGGESTSEYVLVRLRVERITGRGKTHRLRAPVLVVAWDASWLDLLPGQRLRVAGRMSPAAGGDVAAFFRVTGEPTLIGDPGVAALVSEPLRAGLREAVAVVPGPQRGLVPGMVVGDESMLDAGLREDMRITGLTHLTAVSGSNVSMVLLAVLGAARLLGLRGYALPVVAVLGLAGFVLLTRPDPSVLRAAVMGSIAVFGLLVAGRRRALPALAAAVTVLLLADPWLALSVGFALSVLATAGILVLVPAWEAAMSWLPRPLALAVAVPLAAQVACTPVLLVAFGQFSLAALPANMLVAPAVAPAMLLGLAAAMVSPVMPGLASVIAWLAGLPAWWISAVAGWFARLPGATLEWPSGALATAGAIGLALAGVAGLSVLLRRPLVSMLVAIVLVAILFRAVPSPGWPPRDWVLVICDVGQGDASVLRAGGRSAVVVDAGPDPRLVRRCLDALGIVHVPVLVLTHFHADHVDGVPGVLAGRRVDRTIVSPAADPAQNAQQVERWLDAAGVPVTVARAGERWAVGERLSFEVLWPRPAVTSPDESAANNASVVLAARAGGVDVLLTGDIEPSAQRALLAGEPGLRTQVLKVAHHGSRYQEDRMLTGLEAELALIGVGENTHGHPAGEVLRALRHAGIDVRRTDLHGTIAVVRTGDGGLAVATR